jgi:DNA-binding NarL/FixJ family response regulator
MRHPQLLIHEGDGRLAAMLRPLAEARKWSMREPARAGDCVGALRRGGPAVVVVKVGRDLEREMTLLEEMHRLRPEAAVVVVGEAVHAPLIGLAWDLGASYVLLPPEPRERLPEIVAGLMGAQP